MSAQGEEEEQNSPTLNSGYISLVPSDSYTITKDINLPNTSSGSKYLIFAVDNYNNQGESSETNNTYAVPIELFAKADLSITVTDPSTVSLGESIDIAWTVSNDGSDPANANWSDRIYISDDPVFDDNDTYISSQYTDDNTPLAPGDSYSNQENIIISNYIQPGSRYLLFVTDDDNQQGESNETNNVYAAPIEIKEPNLKISETGGLDTPLYGGDVYNISWTVDNTGEANANARWYDSVYFSEDEPIYS